MINPAALPIGQKIAEEMFKQFDEGATFVIISLEKVHHHIFDQAGNYGSGEAVVLEIMKKYLSKEDAEQIWLELTREASKTMNAALIRGYNTATRQ